MHVDPVKRPTNDQQPSITPQRKMLPRIVAHARFVPCRAGGWIDPETAPSSRSVGIPRGSHAWYTLAWENRPGPLQRPMKQKRRLSKKGDSPKGDRRFTNITNHFARSGTTQAAKANELKKDMNASVYHNVGDPRTGPVRCHRSFWVVPVGDENSSRMGQAL